MRCASSSALKLANLFAQVGKVAWETMTLVVSYMRILIRRKSTVRKSIVLESSDRDGSLALSRGPMVAPLTGCV